MIGILYLSSWVAHLFEGTQGGCRTFNQEFAPGELAEGRQGLVPYVALVSVPNALAVLRHDARMVDARRAGQAGRERVDVSLQVGVP